MISSTCFNLGDVMIFGFDAVSSDIMFSIRVMLQL
jgi:hypothetical protein